MIARAERITAPQWAEKKCSFRAASNESGISHCASINYFRAEIYRRPAPSDAPRTGGNEEERRTSLCSLRRTTFFSRYVRTGASLISRSRASTLWLQFKGWITPDARSEEGSQPPEREAVNTRQDERRPEFASSAVSPLLGRGESYFWLTLENWTFGERKFSFSILIF